MNLYYDTILKLYERGYLFEDDPELEEIRVLLSQGRAQSSTDAAGVVSISVFPDNNLSQRLTTRNRVIFPYLRRLLETQKAAMVTKILIIPSMWQLMYYARIVSSLLSTI